MINALFYGIDVNMNKVWTLSYECMWNYVNVKRELWLGYLGIVIGVHVSIACCFAIGWVSCGWVF